MGKSARGFSAAKCDIPVTMFIDAFYLFIFILGAGRHASLGQKTRLTD